MKEKVFKIAAIVCLALAGILFFYSRQTTDPDNSMGEADSMAPSDPMGEAESGLEPEPEPEPEEEVLS